MEVNQQLCDGCGELLTGIKGITKVYREFIRFKGSMQLGEVDKQTRWREHYYLTPHGEVELTFCNLDCVGIYVDHKLTVAKTRRAQKLREETDATFKIGHKTNH